MCPEILHWRKDDFTISFRNRHKNQDKNRQNSSFLSGVKDESSECDWLLDVTGQWQSIKNDFSILQMDIENIFLFSEFCVRNFATDVVWWWKLKGMKKFPLRNFLLWFLLIFMAMIQPNQPQQLKSHKVNEKITRILNSITNCDELFLCDIKRTIFQVHDVFSQLFVTWISIESRAWIEALKPVALDSFFSTHITRFTKKNVWFYSLLATWQTWDMTWDEKYLEWN